MEARSAAWSAAWDLLARHGLLAVPCTVRGTGADKRLSFPGTYAELWDVPPTDALLERVWAGHEDSAGLALLLDKRTDLVAIDTDSEEAEDWARERATSRTPTFRSTRGLKWIFRLDGQDVRSSSGVIHPHVDIKAPNSVLVLPPTPGYIWLPSLSIDEVDPTPLPPKLRATAAKTGKPKVGKDAGPIPEGERNSRLASLAGKMRRAGASEEELLFALRAFYEIRCAHKPVISDVELKEIASSIGKYPPKEGGDEADKTSWDPVDTAAAFAAGLQVDPPALIRRTDGVAMIYAGRANEVHGEPEAGKGWIATLGTHEVVQSSAPICYFDFEDTFGMLVDRLLALGLEEEQIREHVTYVRPLEPLGSRETRASVERVLSTLYRLVILDGLNNALELQSLRSGDTDDIATFFRLLPRRLVDTGAAVLISDLVTKARENRRYAIGSQQKLALVRGASYELDPQQPMGRGRRGTSNLVVSKDTPGWVRQHGVGDGNRFGLLVVDDSRTESALTIVRIEPPAPGGASETDVPPSQRSILRVLNGEAHPLTRKQIVDRIVQWGLWPKGMVRNTFITATNALLERGEVDTIQETGKVGLWWRPDIPPELEAVPE